MKQLFLLDGTWELFRGYYGAPPREAPDGQEVGAVHALLASVLAFLRKDGPTHLAVATDHVVESFRNDLFDGYKTGEGVDPELFAQFPLAEEGLRALGLVVWPMVEFEADDAIASAAKRYARAFDRIVLASPDKDLAQCVVGEAVVQWDRMRDVWRDEQGVVERFGVRPAAIPDYLALVGDSADGLPGVPGFGPKTAARLLAAHGTLERIPSDAGDWKVAIRGGARLAGVLAGHGEAARLYKRLATLRRDVPLAETASDLAWRGVPQAPWRGFCDRLGFGGLADRPHRWR